LFVQVCIAPSGNAAAAAAVTNKAFPKKVFP